MLLILLAYVGGALTIASPCILPVLPFVFARADKPFIRSGLPMLAGMATTFAAVATLAAVGGGWAVEANQYGRVVAMALLAVFGVTLLVPSLSDRLTRPLVALGNRLSRSADARAVAGGSSLLPSALLGIATGLLWAPCAGPVLGLILTGAALGGTSVGTSLLLLSYAAGAVTSLALALLVGGRVFAAMKRSLGVGEWIRRGLAVAVLASVVVIAFRLDTSFLARVSLASTASFEQDLVEKLNAKSATAMQVRPGSMSTSKAMATHAGHAARAQDLDDEGPMPSLAGAVEWLNSPQLTPTALKGKVVLIDFWTYSCINCLRALPYVKAWAEKYKSRGLVVIGVHAPEFAFEKNFGNVRQAIAKLGIAYPVAIDNDYAIWRSFNNQFWPAHYFIDARGRIRHHHFGEGSYAESEQIIRSLLTEAGWIDDAGGLARVNADGAEAAADIPDIQSPETYIGYRRAENFISPDGTLHDAPHQYSIGPFDLNDWGLLGNWTVQGERAVLNDSNGGIAFRFHARDLHLVLGVEPDGTPVRYRVTVDGRPPADDHGADVAADGGGVVSGQRLYQLVRQNGDIRDRTFMIRFLDRGVQAYAFTFG